MTLFYYDLKMEIILYILEIFLSSCHEIEKYRKLFCLRYLYIERKFNT